MVPSKAIVGVDRPMKAPSMHIQKPYQGKIVEVLTAVILSKLFFLNQTPSCICSMCLHCIGKVSNCTIKSCGRTWLAHEGTHHLCIYKSPIRGNCLSSHSCHFVKKYFFLNQTPSCICSMCLHCIAIVSNCSIKSWGRSWSARVWPIIA